MQKGVKLRANAKINLCLDITGRRTDGYHELSMLMQSLDLADEIELEAVSGEETALLILPDSKSGGAGALSREAAADNLMLKAFRLLKEHCGFSGGVRFLLQKNIPVAAGLGGGSADAAAALKGLNALYGLGLSQEELEALGLKLGADVPFALRGGTALACGIGEKLESVVHGMHLKVLLVKPAQGISTPAAYKAYDAAGAAGEAKGTGRPDPRAAAAALREGSLAGLCAAMGNVLQPIGESMVPEIRLIRREMLQMGACAAMMSGSGPTVFGLFEDPLTLSRAARHFESRRDTLNLSDIIETSF